jgi:hypothetical protein
MSYYRVDTREDVEDILAPGQVSRVWCGDVMVQCSSCAGEGMDMDGDMCAECHGAGEVSDVRSGVSVCRTLDDLRAYFSSREWTRKGRVVELDGAESDDEDYDADEPGSPVLIHPTRIIRVMSLRSVFGKK